MAKSLSEADQKDILKVLQKFKSKCTPVVNMIYERYIFNKRVWESGETLEHYIYFNSQTSKLASVRRAERQVDHAEIDLLVGSWMIKLVNSSSARLTSKPSSY